MDETTQLLRNSDDTAGRADAIDLENVNILVDSVEHLQCIIDAMPGAILILNEHRQIVAANTAALKMVQLNTEEILGKRPGELVGCIHSNEGLDGCGTSKHCRVCGAANAILNCLNKTEPNTEECRITLVDGQALDWEVTVSPLCIQGHSLMLAAIRDISDQKRRVALERIFFHDILNTIGAVCGFTQIMADENSENPELKEVIHLTNELMDEVLSQRDLAMAERESLEPKIETVEIESFINRLGQLYQSHAVAENRNLVIGTPKDLTLETDPRLLKRILGNMLKNAFEASSKGQTVYLFCVSEIDSITFGVRNSSVMSEDVRLQVFDRSFSTKANTGRGLGTYSMKLLGEKLLGGKVDFISDPATGTVFTLTLPLQ